MDFDKRELRFGFKDKDSFVAEAVTVADGMLAALGQYPDYRLPEVFAGYDRTEAPFPIDHPMASRPQAWASGSVFLLLATMVGLDLNARDLRGTAFLPSGVQRVCLDGLSIGEQRVVIEAVRSRDGVIGRASEHHSGTAAADD